MPAIPVARSRICHALLAGICAIATSVAGCGQTSQEAKLPDQARKTIERRKVDFEPRPGKSKPATNGSRNPSGR